MVRFQLDSKATIRAGIISKTSHMVFRFVALNFGRFASNSMEGAFLIDLARLSTRASMYDYLSSCYGMVSMAYEFHLGPELGEGAIF